MHKSMGESTAPASIIVGVIPNQPDRVVIEACAFARRLGTAEVHLTYVNPTLIDEDGNPEPLDSDSMDASWHEESVSLKSHVMQVAQQHGIHALFHQLEGDPATQLARCAAHHDAVMIVVGTRERGALDAIKEWINGSVAVRLSHMQDVQVLMIPLGGEYED